MKQRELKLTFVMVTAFFLSNKSSLKKISPNGGSSLSFMYTVVRACSLEKKEDAQARGIYVEIWRRFAF